MRNSDINVKKFTVTHKIILNNKKLCQIRVRHNFLCFFDLKLQNDAATEVKIGGGGADKLTQRQRRTKNKKKLATAV